MGLEMLTFGTKGGENRTLFADMVPGRPRVPRKTSQSQVLGAFWAHILYVFVSIQCHISKIFQRFTRGVFACLLFVVLFFRVESERKGKGKGRERERVAKGKGRERKGKGKGKG